MTRNRRLALEVLPGILLIGYAIIQPMFICFVPLGVVWLIELSFIHK